jgi:hypothetical protein
MSDVNKHCANTVLTESTLFYGKVSYNTNTEIQIN